MKPCTSVLTFALTMAALSGPSLAQVNYSEMALTATLSASPGAKALAFSPDGKHLVAAVGNSAMQWETTSWQPEETLAKYESPISSVSFSPDGAYFASGSTSEDAAVEIYDLQTKKVAFTVTPASDTTCLSFSPDSKYLLIASAAKDILIINVKGGTIEKTIIGLHYPCYSMAWRADDLIAAGGGVNGNPDVVGTGTDGDSSWFYHTDGEYSQFSVPAGALLRQSKLDHASPNIMMSPDGNRVAVVGWGLTVTKEEIARMADLKPMEWHGNEFSIWSTPINSNTGSCKIIAGPTHRQFKITHEGYPAISWAPGRGIVTFGDIEGQYLWSGGASAGSFMQLPGTRKGMQATAFSPNGKVLVGAGLGSLYIWSAP